MSEITKLKLMKILAKNNDRIDIALSKVTEFSRSMIQKLIYAGKILNKNGEAVLKSNHMVEINSTYFITPFEANIKHIVPQKGNLEILFEDNDLIVLNKKAELITHPGAGNYENTLINYLAHHCTLSNINGPEKLGVVHRLDKGVSGCIIFAKNNKSHINLSEQFQNRTIEKKYTAICNGKQLEVETLAQDYISRSKFHRKKMAVQETGKLAIMQYTIKQIFNYENQFFSLIECFPKTGRMHQIRVQLSSRKLPIVQDITYGGKIFSNLFNNRIALHATSIKFKHPISGKDLNIETKLPMEFDSCLQTLSNK